MTIRAQRISLFKKWIVYYLVAAGVSAHVVLVGLFFFTDWLTLAKDRAIVKFKLAPVIAAIWPEEPVVNETPDIAKQIAENFGVWTPRSTAPAAALSISIGGKPFATLQDAAKALNPGDTLDLGPGVYKLPLVISQSQVTIAGHGRVVFDGPTAEGKAAIIVRGKDTRIVNIECKNIKVPSGNGACIRMEGENLTLDHAYFHDSEEGILTGPQPGLVSIRDSRFELLGMNGQAHGIYTGGGELDIQDSLFLASVNEGHEIKSRSPVTKIQRTVVASLGSHDSRLIDIPNGGLVTIKDSVLEKGRQSVNGTAIGYGLEGMAFSNNYLILKNNIIILERTGPNHLLQIKEGSIAPVLVKNLIVSNEDVDYGDANLQYTSRRKAGLAAYPYVPDIRALQVIMANKFQ
ncbi:MAG: hypothetical protein PHW13_07350 [Methylococcales bacterium]|nr:hypothetical protein [Methylococcales bacterium]